MKMFWIGMICVSSIFGADHPVRELSTDALPFRNSLVPYLRHGYLIFFLPGAAAGSPISSIAYGFYAYAPNGKFAFNKNIEVAGGSQPVVRDLDFDKDGNAAVAATAIGGPSGFLNVILLLDHTGSQIGFIDTGGMFRPTSQLRRTDQSGFWDGSKMPTTLRIRIGTII